MPTKRVILDHLTAQELRAVVDSHELHVDDRRVRAQLVDALVRSRKARLDELLLDLSRNRLKELCRAFGLDDSGRKKADIVARLVGPDAASKSNGPRTKPAAARPATRRPGAGTASPKAATQGATTGHEAELWRMADALRGSMDAAEYKHVVLGLIFLKADTYHAWRGGVGAGDYADIPGFCKSAPLEEVRRHGHVLTPGRYVGAAPQEEDDEPFEDKMKRLVAQLRDQRDQGAKLDAAIKANLAALGFGEE